MNDVDPVSPPLPGAVPSASSLRVGPLVLGTPVVLAPMAGVTNASFRRLCREAGESALPPALVPAHPGPLRLDDDHQWAPAGLYVTEMVTTRALVERNEKTLAMVRTDPSERVRSIQLYGVDPDTVAQAVRILVEEDLADHVDLNFGCPVPKVTRKGGGAALPWKRDLFSAIVHAAVRSADDASLSAHRERPVPVTIKMRLGIDEEHETFLDAAATAVGAGVAAVALHARTARQHYSGQADWDQITRLREAVPAGVPVLGNGDVWTGEDAVAMMEATGCDGVVVGRGCQGRPWLFADIVAALSGSGARVRPDLGEVVAVIRRHGELLAAEMGEERGVRDLRKHLGWYLKGYPVGGQARRALMTVRSLAGLDDLLSTLDTSAPYPGATVEAPRGRAGTAKRPHLPDGWLDSPYLSQSESAVLVDAESDVSGG